VPCAARPSTGFFHPEGRCECFFGGPPPQFPFTAGAAPTPVLALVPPLVTVRRWAAALTTPRPPLVPAQKAA